MTITPSCYIRMVGRRLPAVLLASLLTDIVAIPNLSHSENLNQAIETALKTHPRVLTAEAERRAVVQDLAQARSGYFPSVDLNLARGKEHTDTPQVLALGVGSQTLLRRESSVTLTQRIFDGRATSSEVERQTARLDAASQRLAAVREEIALRTAQVYIEVLKNRELVKLANDSLRAHLQTLEKVRLRVRGGVGQRADQEQTLGRVALAKSTVSARAGALREAETNYQTVLGKPAGELLDPDVKHNDAVSTGSIDMAILAQSIRQASEEAASINPALRAANADVNAAEAAVRGAKSAYYPRFNFEASANRNENIAGIPGNFNNEALMLVLRWNLLRGGGDLAQERAFAERRYVALDTAANVRRDVEERVAVALHQKATSEERLGYLQDHVKFSNEALQSYQEQLDLGRRTLLDVLNAENELFTARSNLTVGKYDDLFNQYSVEAAKGTLVRSLGIALSD